MAEKLKKRSEIDDKYKWRLEDIYASDELWEKDFKEVKKIVVDLQKFKGKITETSNSLFEALESYFELDKITSKLHSYANMRSHEDLNVAKYQEMVSRMDSMVTDAESELVFFKIELMSLTQDKLKEYIKQNDRLKVYEFYFEKLFRFKEHTLSDNEEKILALAGETVESAANIYEMFNNTDIKFDSFIDEEGNEVELTKGNYTSYAQSYNRGIRKDVFEKLYKSYMSYKNTFGTMINGRIKSDLFIAKAKKYKSSLSQALYSDNIDISVYDSLIETVHNNFDKLHNYCELRKKTLKIEELHMYDLYVPLVEDYNDKIPFEKALEIVKNSLSVLGEEYIKDFSKCVDEKWIDVFENEGKRGGAYSWGAYGTHPYVLLNHQDNLNSLFTITHEMGHSMHSYYTRKTQPFVYADYTIFVAEVASTVNEVLTMKYLLKNSKDKKEKMYLLNHFMDEFRTTLYRQTKFAEFEKITHEKIQNGEALSADKICDIYYDLNKLYYGSGMNVDEQIKIEWARIPHFYSSFYVYKYATGFSTAVAIAEKIDSGDKETLKNYLNFLRSGSSDYSLELLKKVGVDLTTPQPVQRALNLFGELIKEFEEMMK